MGAALESRGEIELSGMTIQGEGSFRVTGAQAVSRKRIIGSRIDIFSFSVTGTFQPNDAGLEFTGEVARIEELIVRLLVVCSLLTLFQIDITGETIEIVSLTPSVLKRFIFRSGQLLGVNAQVTEELVLSGTVSIVQSNGIDITQTGMCSNYDQ